MRIYVAGASAEVERAAAFMERCRNAGVEVVSTWAEAIKAEPVADRDLKPSDAIRYAEGDIEEIEAADGLVLLVPPPGRGAGAYVEFGWALGCPERWTMVVGDPAQSVFFRLADMHAPNEDAALAELRDIASEGVA